MPSPNPTAPTGTEYRQFPLPAFVSPLASSDALQGNFGDCGLIAAMNALAARRPDVIRSAISDLGGGVWNVRLWRNSTWNDVAVDDWFPALSYQVVPYGARYPYSKGCLWPSLIEKAIAILYGSWQAGLSAATAFSLLTGIEPETTAVTGLSGAEVHALIAAALSSGFAACLSSYSGATSPILPSHVYGVESAGDGTVTLRVTWGYDGASPAWDAAPYDGLIEIPDSMLTLPFFNLLTVGDPDPMPKTATLNSTGGNILDDAAWDAGGANAHPVAGDTIHANASSGPLNITAATEQFAAVDFTGYTGTITMDDPSDEAGWDADSFVLAGTVVAGSAGIYPTTAFTKAVGLKLGSTFGPDFSTNSGTVTCATAAENDGGLYSAAGATITLIGPQWWTTIQDTGGTLVCGANPITVSGNFASSGTVTGLSTATVTIGGNLTINGTCTPLANPHSWVMGTGTLTNSIQTNSLYRLVVNGTVTIAGITYVNAVEGPGSIVGVGKALRIAYGKDNITLVCDLSSASTTCNLDFWHNSGSNSGAVVTQGTVSINNGSLTQTGRVSCAVLSCVKNLTLAGGPHKLGAVTVAASRALALGASMVGWTGAMTLQGSGGTLATVSASGAYCISGTTPTLTAGSWMRAYGNPGATASATVDVTPRAGCGMNTMVS